MWGVIIKFIPSTKEEILFDAKYLCERSLFCTSYVKMEFIEDARQKMKFQASYTIVMLQPMGDTLPQKRQL